MFSYLELSEAERDKVIRILLSYLDSDKSKIVKVCSMQTLAAFAEKDKAIGPQVIAKLREIVEVGSPAMVSRAKKLLG